MVVIKTLPPATVSGMIVWGIPLNEWILILTGAWIIIQLGFLIYDRFTKRNK